LFNESNEPTSSSAGKLCKLTSARSRKLSNLFNLAYIYGLTSPAKEKYS
jgi:hypothetical protein